MATRHEPKPEGPRSWLDDAVVEKGPSCLVFLIIVIMNRHRVAFIEVLRIAFFRVAPIGFVVGAGMELFSKLDVRLCRCSNLVTSPVAVVRSRRIQMMCVCKRFGRLFPLQAATGFWGVAKKNAVEQIEANERNLALLSGRHQQNDRSVDTPPSQLS